MVPPFNNFIFDHKVGEKGVVKTDFGYHYIEILSQKGSVPAYKIAYLAKKIEASDETERNAENSALQFAGESRDLKSFEANWEKGLKPKGQQKLFAPDINSHAYDIPGVGVSRKFIKGIFDADRGDVLQPERVGDNFVVAVVTQINKPGVMSVAAARQMAEPILRNQKKAAILKKRVGSITTLEAVSAAMKQPVQTTDSIRFSGSGKNQISYESKVVGAAFNPANKGKVVNEPIESNYGGVYIIRVDDVVATIVENADINAQKKNFESQGRMRILMSNQYSQFSGYGQQYDPAAVLRKAATIKDYRNKFY
jgi:peptidyl-prolyl cis-trans isomerase D